jgi:hypothetical protein
LEEKAPGRPLGSLWYQWPMHSRLDIIRQIVDIEQKLAATTFTKSGCIYFKGDVPANLSSDLEVPTGVQIHSSVLEPFEIGPLVSTELWHGKRAGMNMHRGPCECTLLNYLVSVILTAQIMSRLSLWKPWLQTKSFISQRTPVLA